MPPVVKVDGIPELNVIPPPAIIRTLVPTVAKVGPRNEFKKLPVVDKEML